MKVAIMQPYFFPYLGYFQLINAVDKFIIYDDIEYTKKGWINRNRILQNGKPTHITLPIKKDSDFLNIDQRYLSDDWIRQRQKILRLLENNYRKAPYFKDTYALLQDILNFNSNNLFDFIYNILTKLLSVLEISTTVIRSSKITFDNSLKGQEKVLEICKTLDATVYINAIGGVQLYNGEDFNEQGISLNFLKSLPFKYKQFDDTFVPYLSIIDVMMFNSQNEVISFLKNFELVQ